jgi:hypothetical protein
MLSILLLVKESETLSIHHFLMFSTDEEFCALTNKKQPWFQNNVTNHFLIHLGLLDGLDTE